MFAFICLFEVNRVTGTACACAEDSCVRCNVDVMSAQTCTLCQESRYLHNGFCLEQCPDGFFPAGLSDTGRSCQVVLSTPAPTTSGTCLLGAVVSTNQQPCQCPSNCALCEFDASVAVAASCDLCLNSTVLHDGTCRPECPDGFDAVGPANIGGVCLLTAAGTERPTTTSASPSEPALVRFELYEDSLVLFFTEPVVAASLKPTGITLQAQPSMPVFSSLRLQGGTVIGPAAALRLTVMFTSDDLNQLKYLTNLGTLLDNTYLAFAEDSAVTLLDSAPVRPIPTSSALGAALVFGDATPPQLVGFDLVMGSAAGVSVVLVLRATEPLSLTVNYADIILQSTSGHPALAPQVHSLTQAPDVMRDPTNLLALRMVLGPADVAAIKQLPPLVQTANQTFLSLGAAALRDTAGNHILPVVGVAVTTHTVDLVSPTLLAFDLDLNALMLVLVFSEPVVALSLQPTLLTLHGPASSYSLLGGIVAAASSDTLTVQLTHEDVLNISLDDSLAVDAASTTLSYLAGLVYDLAGNPAVGHATPINVRNFQPDTRAPLLVAVALDMEQGLLKLDFNEPVDLKTFQPAKVAFDSPVTGLSVVWLTGAVATQTLAPVQLMLALTADDVLIIKSLAGVAKSLNTTVVRLAQGAVQDYSGNSLATISLAASAYFPDVTAPTVTRFDLVFADNGKFPLVIVLHISEPVFPSHVDVTRIALRSCSVDGPATQRVVLTRDSQVSLHGLTEIWIVMSTLDTAALRAQPPLARGPEFTWLELEYDAVVDTSGNKLDDKILMPVTVYSVDVVRPQLVAFDVDMNTGTFVLFFSKSVDVASIDVTGLIAAGSSLAADTQVILVPEASHQVTLTLTSMDLNRLKADRSVFVSRSTATLDAAEVLIKDVAGNAVEALVGLEAANFSSDVTSGHLLQAAVDLKFGTVLLTFSETMDAGTLDPKGLSIQNVKSYSRRRLEPVQFNLRGGAVSPDNSDRLQVNLTSSDLRLILHLRGFAKTADTTFIAFAAGAVLDMAGNPVVGIDSAAALGVSGFVPAEDTVENSADGSDNDLTTKKLILLVVIIVCFCVFMVFLAWWTTRCCERRRSAWFYEKTAKDSEHSYAVVWAENNPTANSVVNPAQALVRKKAKRVCRSEKPSYMTNDELAWQNEMELLEVTPGMMTRDNRTVARSGVTPQVVSSTSNPKLAASVVEARGPLQIPPVYPVDLSKGEIAPAASASNSQEYTPCKPEDLDWTAPQAVSKQIDFDAVLTANGKPTNTSSGSATVRPESLLVPNSKPDYITLTIDRLEAPSNGHDADPPPCMQYRATQNYIAEEQHQLSLFVGDWLSLLRVDRKNGIAYMEDDHGQKGVVPLMAVSPCAWQGRGSLLQQCALHRLVDRPEQPTTIVSVADVPVNLVSTQACAVSSGSSPVPQQMSVPAEPMPPTASVQIRSVISPSNVPQRPVEITPPASIRAQSPSPQSLPQPISGSAVGSEEVNLQKVQSSEAAISKREVRREVKFAQPLSNDEGPLCSQPPTPWYKEARAANNRLSILSLEASPGNAALRASSEGQPSEPAYEGTDIDWVDPSLVQVGHGVTHGPAANASGSDDDVDTPWQQEARSATGRLMDLVRVMST